MMLDLMLCKLRELRMHKSTLSFFTLFTSLSTLVCCALPALFVSLGFGATFVSVLGIFPQLIWFSEHKSVVFTFAGICLFVAGIMRWKSTTLACPADVNLAANCQETKIISSRLFYLSIALYLTGGFFAFIAPRIF